MSQVILSGLIWAFSFWLVADCLRRRRSPLWVIAILLLQPYGGIAYLVYLLVQQKRGELPSVARRGAVPVAVPNPAAVSAEPALDVADQLEEQRRFSEAVALYQRALTLQKDDPRALHGLGRSLIELDRPREALEAFEALMGIDPRYRNYAAALEYAEALHRTGRDTDATGLLEGLVQETGRMNHRLALAHYCEAAGQTARARSVLSDALSVYASSPQREQDANRHWHRRITDMLAQLAPG